MSTRLLSTWREQIERGWLQARSGRLTDGRIAIAKIRRELKKRSKRVTRRAN